MRTRRAAAWALAVFLLLSGCAPAPAAVRTVSPVIDLPSPGAEATPPPGLFPGGFPLILQNPELPNGCEITSLAMLLCQAGYDADKVDLAEHYLPRVDFTEVDGVRLGPDPGRDYAGDPADDSGWYCFEGPILAAANRYLAERDDGDFIVADPLSGWRRVPAEILMPSFEAMGSRAVALLKAG